MDIPGILLGTNMTGKRPATWYIPRIQITGGLTLKKILLLVCLAALSTNMTGASGKKKAMGREPAAEKPVQRKDGGPTLNDAGIAAAVEARIAGMPSLKNAGIKAESKDGNVTLTGIVANYPRKGVATRAAKKVDGVKSVKNQITVAPGAPKPGKSKSGMSK